MTTSSPTKPKKKTQTQLKAEQTERLLAALQSARNQGVYPTTIKELAPQAEVAADIALKLFAAKALQTQVLLAAKDVAAPLVLADDQQQLFASDAFWLYVATKVRDKRAQANQPLATEPKKIVTDAGLETRVKAGALEALLACITHQSVPATLTDLLLIKPPKPPKPPKIVKVTPAQLAVKLVAALRQHQILVPQSPLVPVSNLINALEPPATDAAITAALKSASFKKEAIAVDGEMASPGDATYLLRSELNIRMPQLTALVLDARVKESNGTTLFAAKDLATMLFKGKNATEFAAALETYCDHHPQLAPAIAWLRSKGARLFFRVQDVEPQALPANKSAVAPVPAVAPQPQATPTADFATQFAAVFARLDAQQGGRNFLKVHELRQALSQFSRAEFDAGLRQLRLADRYTMEGASGTLPLSAEERAAGIQEGPLLLIYVSRK